MKIRLTVNGTSATATMIDSPAARDLRRSLNSPSEGLVMADIRASVTVNGKKQ
jgi:hypothetical protein